MRAEGIEQAEAEELVDTVDKERAAFLEKYFHREWPNRSIYHAMLNTACGDEAVTRAMLDFKKMLERKEE
ncbi:MAG: cytidylate kinase family protein [Acidobacteriota bacterium]